MASAKRVTAWRTANPEKAKAISDRANLRRKEKMAAQKQIKANPDLIVVTP